MGGGEGPVLERGESPKERKSHVNIKKRGSKKKVASQRIATGGGKKGGLKVPFKETKEIKRGEGNLVI